MLSGAEDEPVDSQLDEFQPCMILVKLSDIDQSHESH